MRCDVGSGRRAGFALWVEGVVLTATVVRRWMSSPPSSPVSRMVVSAVYRVAVEAEEEEAEGAISQCGT